MEGRFIMKKSRKKNICVGEFFLSGQRKSHIQSKFPLLGRAIMYLRKWSGYIGDLPHLGILMVKFRFEYDRILAPCNYCHHP